MNDLPHNASDLQQIYERRFAGQAEYRRRVWARLCRFFEQWIGEDASVMDLGSGHCEFINAVHCGRKFAMDMNPDARAFANTDVIVMQQNCAEQWQVPEETLSVVFTSNFLEHLPSKTDVEATLRHAHDALVPGGRLIAVGPNIKFVSGAYWDFFDHYVPLTERSLAEVLTKCGFTIERSFDRFLPYTMSHGRQHPLWLLGVYLRYPALWPLFGKQFLLVACKAI